MLSVGHVQTGGANDEFGIVGSAQTEGITVGSRGEEVLLTEALGLGESTKCTILAFVADILSWFSVEQPP